MNEHRRTNWRWTPGVWLLLSCLPALLPDSIRAHTPSETYLTLQILGTNLVGRWDVALRDLHQGMGVTPDEAARIPTGQLREREEALALDVGARLEIRANDRPAPLVFTDYTVLPLNGIDYARLIFQVERDASALLSVDVNAAALFRIDTNMHGLLRLEHHRGTEAVAFNPARPAYRFELRDGASGGLGRWLTFVSLGAWHIWEGLDHVLFLLALLLPAVFRREEKRWVGVDAFRPAFINVLKIVTAFTIAHSLTLTLATLRIVQLPSRWVEVVVAASVALAAANNLWPRSCMKGWQVAGCFGLIHGFGFATALVDLGLTGGSLAQALVGFNVGVELGQAAVVAVFLPLAFALRESWWYRTLFFRAGSLLVLLAALVWMLERIIGRF